MYLWKPKWTPFKYVLTNKTITWNEYPTTDGSQRTYYFSYLCSSRSQKWSSAFVGEIVYWKVVFLVFTYVIHLDQSDAYVIYSVFPFQVLDQTHDPPDTAITTVLKSVSLVIIIAAGLLENACVISTIVKDKKLHRAPYYYMINLSVADLLRSIFCLPIILSTVLQVCMNYIIKHGYYFNLEGKQQIYVGYKMWISETVKSSDKFPILCKKCSVSPRWHHYISFFLSSLEIVKHILYKCFPQGSVWRYGKSGCTMLAFSSTFFMFGALFALLILALDRYLAVVHQR